MDISNAPIMMVYVRVIVVLLSGSQAGMISLLHIDNLNALLKGMDTFFSEMNLEN